MCVMIFIVIFVYYMKSVYLFVESVLPDEYGLVPSPLLSIGSFIGAGASLKLRYNHLLTR